MSLFARTAVTTGLASLSASALAVEKNGVNLQTPVTEVASQIYNMHTLMLIICLVIFIGVFGVMFWSVFKHRKSKGAVAAHFHENTTVEIVWTVVPVLILLGMAYPATKTVIAMKDTSNPDITIKATGYQWKWGYDYIKGEGEGIRLISNLSTSQEAINGNAEKGDSYLLEVDEPLVVPVGKKIRILTTANDVIHAWWVPAFGVKQDAIPGFIRDTWFRAEKEGIYRGNCAELCGKDHGFMPIEVHVVSDADYTAWVKTHAEKAEAAAEGNAKVWDKGDLVATGEKVFNANCAACHQADGKGLPPAFPALDGSAVVNGPVGEQLNTVMHGRPGTAMAAFGNMLDDAQLAAVITYTRNAWGNTAGDVIQPADVAAARN
ncbi:cytochrome c oxidase subunit II [Nitrogeniibacter aestuarii]|uniref:cytochrome c oxidase subunit II n=1 Tax=Nitrogeniibacter aestuarii TaxID=2815343 RepID=UPI001D121203|nr:cytochrome c oxidase subunit II [Nitrogeniibacter aestuarii]